MAVSRVTITGWGGWKVMGHGSDDWAVLYRESCRLYQQKYRDKLQSLSPSSSLLHEIQVSRYTMSCNWSLCQCCSREPSFLLLRWY